MPFFETFAWLIVPESHSGPSLGYAQIHLVNSYTAVTHTLRSIYTESYGNISDDVSEVNRQQTHVGEYANTIREEDDASTVSPIDSITGEQFNAKVDQIETEWATIDGIATQLDGLEAPFEAFTEQVQHYRTKKYEKADFYPVRRHFGEVQEGLATIEAALSLEPLLEETRCLFDALVKGTREMEDAVRARRNSEHQTAKDYERAAVAVYESCDKLVEEVKPVADLVDTIPR